MSEIKSPSSQTLFEPRALQKDWQNLCQLKANLPLFEGDAKRILDHSKRLKRHDAEDTWRRSLLEMIYVLAEGHRLPEDLRFQIFRQVALSLRSLHYYWHGHRKFSLWMDLLNALRQSRAKSKPAWTFSDFLLREFSQQKNPVFLNYSGSIPPLSVPAFEAHQTADWLGDLDRAVDRHKLAPTDENKFLLLQAQYILGKNDHRHLREMAKLKVTKRIRFAFRLRLILDDRSSALRIFPTFAALSTDKVSARPSGQIEAQALTKIEKLIGSRHQDPLAWLELAETLDHGIRFFGRSDIFVLLMNLVYKVTKSEQNRALEHAVRIELHSLFESIGPAIDPSRNHWPPTAQEDTKAISPPVKGLPRSLESFSLSMKVMKFIGKEKLKQVLTPQRRDIFSPQDRLQIVHEVVSSLRMLRGPLMKVGQIASYAVPGLLREEQDVLATLTNPDHLGQLSQECRQQIKTSPFSSEIRKIDPWPVGVGSLSQVFRVEKTDGTVMAVKTLYPDIDAILKSDLLMLRSLKPILRFVVPHMPFSDLYHEVETTFRREADLRNEASTANIIRKFFRDDPDIQIPFYNEASASKTCVEMEFAVGMSFREFLDVASPLARKRAGEAIVRFFLTCLNNRLFSTDLHEGNFLFSEEGIVTCLDFGSFETWDEVSLNAWTGIARAYLNKDFALFQKSISSVGMISAKAKSSDLETIFHTLTQHRDQYWTSQSEGLVDGSKVERETRDLYQVNLASRHIRAYPRFTFAFRAYIGVLQLLARLEARANWAAVFERHLNSHSLSG